MPVTNELDLPIRHVTVSGLAADVLDRRKENSSNPKIEATELRKNFNGTKDALFAGMKDLTRAISNEIAEQRLGRGIG